jgi:hypothetical protein
MADHRATYDGSIRAERLVAEPYVSSNQISMKRLILLTLLAVVHAPATGAAQPEGAPAALRTVAYTAPPGYTAAPALGDSLTALYTQARTAVFLAALPDPADRGAFIVRVRGLLAHAVAPGDNASLQWRMLSSAPASPYDVYHERWIGYDGNAAVIADFHHLRKDGRDLLTGSAFHTREGQPARMFQTGIAPTTHALSARASARMVAELVGDPPYDEAEPDFSGMGGTSGTPPEPPENPEETAIRAAFEGYRTALLARDGEGALPHVSQSVLEYYGYVRDLALYASAAEVRARPLSDQLFVLLLRHRIPSARLRGMTAREVFAHGVAQGWISDEQTRTQQIGRIGVTGNMAFAEVLIGGQRSPIELHFVRQEGAWKWDMLGVIQWMDTALRSVAESAGVTPEALLLRLTERVAGRRAAPTLWDPPFPRPERSCAHAHGARHAPPAPVDRAARRRSSASWSTMARTKTAAAPAQPQPGYPIRRHSRSWKVIDPAGQLVYIPLYEKGVKGVIRRLESPPP